MWDIRKISNMDNYLSSEKFIKTRLYTKKKTNQFIQNKF